MPASFLLPASFGATFPESSSVARLRIYLSARPPMLPMGIIGAAASHTTSLFLRGDPCGRQRFADKFGPCVLGTCEADHTPIADARTD